MTKKTSDDKSLLKEQEQDKGKKGSVFWTPQMDDAFIKVMLTEQDKGNRPGGTFSPQAYKNMVSELSEKLKLNLKKSNLQNRLRTIKEKFAICYDVFRGTSLSGFSWNPVTELLEAEEEVWKDLIEANPDASIWKSKTVSNYDELYMLFAKDRANGDSAETAKERRKRMHMTEDRVETVVMEDIDEIIPTNEIGLEDINDGDDIQVIPSLPSQMKPHKSKKKKVENDIDLASEIKGSFKNVADAMKECTKAIVGSRPRVYSGGEICKELELMGVEEDVIAGAFVFLLKSPQNTQALFDCPLPMRLPILKEMMGTSD